jgi:hypothetical protein
MGSPPSTWPGPNWTGHSLWEHVAVPFVPVCAQWRSPFEPVRRSWQRTFSNVPTGFTPGVRFLLIRATRPHHHILRCGRGTADLPFEETGARAAERKHSVPTSAFLDVARGAARPQGTSPGAHGRSFTNSDANRIARAMCHPATFRNHRIWRRRDCQRCRDGKPD